MKSASLPAKKPARGPNKRVKHKSPISGKAAYEKSVFGAGLPRYAPEETPAASNSLTVLPIDPNRIFAHWELPAALSKKPTIRVIDVTKKTDGVSKTHDIRVKPQGSAYIKVSPGRRYILRAGFFDVKGKFVPMGRPEKVSTPRATPPRGKSLLPAKYFEAGFPEGSRKK